MGGSGDRSLGLSSDDARLRLAADGPNDLPKGGRRTLVTIIVSVLKEPMLALLLGGGLIYLLIGEASDALILLAFATLSIIITTVQEARTERVLDSLRDLSSPRARVIRDGTRQVIAGREVVVGDVLVLGEGDRVSADATLFDVADLKLDESLLTGESVPVTKAIESGESATPRRPGGDGSPLIYSGTLVVRGQGLARVHATGAQTEMGRIGVSLNRLETETPRLQRDMRWLVLSLGLFGGLASLSAVLLYGLLRGNWLDAILAGIALGMSMLPEEFPVVLTVFMAMGAWRISRARVLTRRAAAIETLGSATVLCTDKTGTLTENRMQVAALWSAASGTTRVEPGAALPPPLALMLDTAALASAPDPFDPMERAFHAARPNPHPNNMALLVSYPLRPDLLVMTQIWDRNGSAYAAAKGAPEAVLHLCRLPDDERRRISAAVDSLAAEGLRVLALAAADLGSAPLPETQNDLPLQFLGLIGLADPLRAGIPEAVRQCRSAGIRIIMVTGDYPVTARAIARAAGIDHEAVLSGDEVATLDDAALADRLKTVSIFARVMPEQKLRLVETLKRQGEIVAMTGDGVNDGPSLKAAHIGIAMGGRGTDVAREASALVLLDDDFASIVAAIRLGRRIYDNLRKAAGFILAVHVPIAALALLPLALGLPVILWPIHIAFLEMVIDPVCSLVFESEGEEKDIMTRPPRPARGSLFSRQLVVASLIRGGLAFATVFAVLIYAALNALPETSARGLAFTTLLLAILALIVGNRTFSSGFLAGLRGGNPLLVFVPIGMLALIGVSQFLPPARDLFRFGPLSGVEIALALCAAAALMVGISLERRIERRLTRR